MAKKTDTLWCEAEGRNRLTSPVDRGHATNTDRQVAYRLCAPYPHTQYAYPTASQPLLKDNSFFTYCALILNGSFPIDVHGRVKQAFLSQPYSDPMYSSVYNPREQAQMLSQLSELWDMNAKEKQMSYINELLPVTLGVLFLNLPQVCHSSSSDNISLDEQNKSKTFKNLLRLETVTKRKGVSENIK